MERVDVLAKLEEFKGRPIAVGLGDEGAILWGNIDGHWLFTTDTTLVEVKKNVGEATHGVNKITQFELPFVVTTVNYDMISYVKSYINHENGDIDTHLAGLVPGGTDKSLDEIIKELQGDSIRKVNSVRGALNVQDTAPNGSYGKFMGTYISTDISGIPKNVSKAVMETPTEENTSNDPVKS